MSNVRLEEINGKCAAGMAKSLRIVPSQFCKPTWYKGLVQGYWGSSQAKSYLLRSEIRDWDAGEA